MAFTSYMTYTEYKELGGKVSEDAFPLLERKAQRYLDSFTFNRVQYLTIIPDEVKEVLTDFIDRLNDYDSQATDGDTIEKYSNGVETIEYRQVTELELARSLCYIAYKWLPDYLITRSVNFDVNEYLQSNSNNP